MNAANENARRQPGATFETAKAGHEGRTHDATIWPARGARSADPFRQQVTRGRFRREWLPDAATFYSDALDKLGSPNGTGWAMARCPYHDDTHASLSVNLRGGHFRCHACGAHGPGLIAFLRLRDGLDFEQACKALGAWESRR